MCKDFNTAAEHGLHKLVVLVQTQLQQGLATSWQGPLRIVIPTYTPAQSSSNATQSAADDNNNRSIGSDSSSSPASLWTWASWEGILSNPAGHSLETLRKAAKALNIVRYYVDSQDSLIQVILAEFGLTAPSTRPAVLLAAVARERSSFQLVWDGPDECAALNAALERLAMLARELYIPLGLKAQVPTARQLRYAHVSAVCTQQGGTM